MCHCFLLYSAKSSAKTRSFKHCLKIEYNPKAVAPADAKLIRCSVVTFLICKAQALFLEYQ
jgi:hypothetical protein